ncbi:MAG: helix-turn-helix transcriptional regulator [Oscillospiraceae bacterium]|nr:helix-turn-helix transcriptional regulator [Oscillospiraceae bacterium]MBP3700050.1 helix-turn-helix transcriptional regulator [Oscillospiraceae bacterium]
MVDLVEIGKRIQGRRKQMGLTQEQLADKMDVSIQMVSNLERGNKSIRIENLIKLSEILNISTDYILTGKETAEDMQVLIEQMTSLSQKERKMMKLLMDFCLSENDE